MDVVTAISSTVTGTDAKKYLTFSYLVNFVLQRVNLTVRLLCFVDDALMMYALAKGIFVAVLLYTT